MGRNNEIYNKSLDDLEDYEKDGKVFIISPSSPVEVSRFESDIEKLGSLYQMGYNDTIKIIPEIKEYLGI